MPLPSDRIAFESFLCDGIGGITITVNSPVTLSPGDTFTITGAAPSYNGTYTAIAATRGTTIQAIPGHMREIENPYHHRMVYGDDPSRAARPPQIYFGGEPEDL